MRMLVLVLMPVFMGMMGVLVFMRVSMLMLMLMLVLVSMRMNLSVLVGIFVLIVGVRAPRVDAEFYSLDVLALLALEVHVKIPDIQFGKLPLEGRGLHSQVAERADGHVAADTRKTVEKKDSHREIRTPQASLP